MKRIAREDRIAGAVIICSILVLPWLIPLAMRPLLSPSNSILNWLPDAEETVQLVELGRTFQMESQPKLICSWDGCSLTDPRVDLLIQGIERRDGWEAVSGRQLIEQMVLDTEDLTFEEVKNRLIGSAIGPDGKSSLILLTPPNSVAITDAINIVYRTAEQRCSLSKDQVYLAGAYVNQHALDQETFRVFFPFSVLAGLVTIVVAWICLRSFLLVILLLVSSVGGVAYGLAALSLGNVSMSALHTMLPALWFILSVSAGTHLLNYLREAVSDGQRQPVASAVRSSLRPCLSAIATTVVGFLSLSVSRLVPVREFGIWATVGLVLATLHLYLFFPAMLTLLRVSRRSWPSRARADSVIVWMNSRIKSWRVAIVVLSLLATIVLALGLPNLRFVAGFYALFDPDATIRRDLTWFEEHIGPQQSILAILKMPVEADEDFVELITLGGKIHSAIEQNDSSANCISASQWVKFPRQQSGMAGVIARSTFRAKLASKSDMMIQAGMLSLDRTTMILNVQLQSQIGQEEDALRRIHVVAQNVLDEHPSMEASFSLTGYLPLRNAIRKELRRSLGLSLLLTSILVALSMWVALRDTGLAILSILPNVIPIVFSFGLLGWSGVPIDIGSMMTASIALGIAVDDTFHMLVAYQRQKTFGDGAVDRALKQTYFPILCTSLICGAGMLVFLACDFIAAARFGGLLATMLMAALFGDLVLLPALLMIASNRSYVEDQ